MYVLIQNSLNSNSSFSKFYFEQKQHLPHLRAPLQKRTGECQHVFAFKNETLVVRNDDLSKINYTSPLRRTTP